MKKGGKKLKKKKRKRVGTLLKLKQNPSVYLRIWLVLVDKSLLIVLSVFQCFKSRVQYNVDYKRELETIDKVQYILYMC